MTNPIIQTLRETPIGEIVTYQGAELVVLEEKREYCENCHFEIAAAFGAHKGCKLFDIPFVNGEQPCFGSNRPDRTAVIFMPYDKYVVARLKGEL